MPPSTALNDAVGVLVADTSTIINLIATGVANDVLTALPHRVVVADCVPTELEVGRTRGRAAYDALMALAAAAVIDIVALPEAANAHFESLVVGDAVETLDDGEAATIAYAVECSATALVDERKATRISAQRFPTLRVACTVDVLIHPAVQARLGEERLREAVFGALNDGKMSVLPQHLEWIVALIGEERAARCPSLPERVRRRDRCKVS